MSKKFIYYFNSRTLFMGIGLSLLLSASGALFFLSIILGYIFGIILLYLVKKNDNKYSCFISSLVFMIISLIILVNMISTMYLVNMPRVFIMIPFILLIIYTLFKDAKIVIRLSYMLITINISLYLISFISLIKYFDLSNFVIKNITITNILKGSIIYFLFSTSPLLNIKENDKTIFKVYTISTITMMIIGFLTFSIMGGNLVKIIRYPEYVILKKVSISNAITNIENLVSFMWLIDLFMMYLTSSSNILNKINKKYCIIAIIISVFITFLVNNNYSLLLIIYNYSLYFLLLVTVITLITRNKKVD